MGNIEPKTNHDHARGMAQVPRRRPRTRLHMLADTITSLERAGECLQEIDLRTTSKELRVELKAARDSTAHLLERTRHAYKLAAEESLRASSRPFRDAPA